MSRRSRVILILLAGALLFGQALWVVDARFEDLVSGVHGMADIIRRASPPDVSNLKIIVWPALETIDIALFGTIVGVIMAIPFAVMAARNVTPSRALYVFARAVIGLTRAVPDLIWALLFVTAVGLGPFSRCAGALGPFDRHAGPAFCRNH